MRSCCGHSSLPCRTDRGSTSAACRDSRSSSPCSAHCPAPCADRPCRPTPRAIASSHPAASTEMRAAPMSCARLRRRCRYAAGRTGHSRSRTELPLLLRLSGATFQARDNLARFLERPRPWPQELHRANRRKTLEILKSRAFQKGPRSYALVRDRVNRANSLSDGRLSRRFGGIRPSDGYYFT